METLKVFASYIPIMGYKKGTAIVQNGEIQDEKKFSAIDLLNILEPGSELYIVMGSTNAPISEGAIKKGVKVFQLPHSKAKEMLGTSKKVTPEDVYLISEEDKNAFYTTPEVHVEVLQIVSFWNDYKDTINIASREGNRLRAKLKREALSELKFNSTKQLESWLDDLAGNAEKGIKPSDPLLKQLWDKKDRIAKDLDNFVRKSSIFKQVFSGEKMKHVGTRIAARIIAGVERIERYPTAVSLSADCGMVPNDNGKLPKRRKGGGQVYRNPLLNTACWALQDHMETYGKNTYLGEFLQEEKKKRDRKEARIVMTRHFIENILYPRWMEYVKENY